MHKKRRAAALLGALALVLGLAPLGASEPVAAAPEHRALIIVDTGATVIKRSITFSEDSISGVAALQRAGADPVVYTYAGQGGAVCRLFGVGRDAGPGCLGGAGGDPRYWAYWRAPAGTGSFTYSRIGAGATQVRDGDVEGWRFGTGDAPPYSPVPPATPPPTAAPPPPSTAPAARPGGGGTSGGGAPAAGGGTTTDPAAPGAPAVDPATGAPVAGPDAAVSTTTAPPAGELPDTGRDATRDGKDVSTQEAAARRSVGDDTTDDGGGAPWSLALLAVLLAGLAGAVVVVRRRRSP